MRISDWSSDVCSSDLLERQVRVDVDEARHQCRIAKVDDFGAFRNSRFAADRDDFSVVHDNDRIVAQPFARRVEKMGGAKGDRPGAVFRRSEEHTSELQSLMRISYAVFCLKKKNKNNKTHTEHEHSTS